MTGKEQATEDWKNKVAGFYFVGDLYSRQPTLHQSGLLQYTCYDSEFSKEYNAEIKKLIAEKGFPAWSPGNRIPSLDEVQLLINKIHPISEFRPTRQEEKQLLRDIKDIWHPTVLKGFLRMEDVNLLMFMGCDKNSTIVEFVDLYSNSRIKRLELTSRNQ